ncbi:PTS fructose transporter subunit IIBC [Parafrankia soli]|uniref:PTS fructose transporter subunit IIBC n=1 Tax=Parafrankia soli TaxID=2599596 RepID=A0A1S1PF36_9ACTN|nr:fructose-specific PTS transporter subunit EIIC [Parafrankia soli]OHV19769.1 PTS fructose transporter subunit IIBC [Parafrankia soli]
MNIVAVTSCPTGIAHTYMAAEALEQAARAAGHGILVETQGAAGTSVIPPADIASADAVVLAADVEVRERSRFTGKPTVTASVKRAINDAAGLIAEAEQLVQAAGPAETAGAAGAATRAAHTGTARGAGPATKVDPAAGLGIRLRQWLMTGVSYMIPFVAAGGILIALAFMVGGAEVATKVNGGEFEGVTYPGVTNISDLLEQAGWAGLLFKIGATAFSMLVPILAGFIAYAMADRMGIAPGIVAGLLAGETGAGFLGGLLGGLLAGGIVLVINRVKVPRAVAGLMPVVVVPMLASLVVGALMIVVVGEPVAAATDTMTDWLQGLGGSNAVLLGGLLGLMMAFDMGGPVNKVAYTFALASLAAGNQEIMAAVMAAGMTPPIALALATVVRPKLFSPAERKAGEAGWLLGASFITEGAIPFAAADPLRVIPSLMAGSAVTGALSMALGATSRAPHGGIWVVGLIGRPVFYLVAIVAGVLVTAAAVIVAKSLRRPATGQADSASAVPGQEYATGVADPYPAATSPVAAGANQGAR